MTHTLSPAPVEELDFGQSNAPACWTVWGAWRTTPYGFAALVKTVQRELGPDARVTVEAAVRAGLRTYGADAQPTVKELQRFRWLRITGDAADARLEVELARRSRRTGSRRGKGVMLRTWGSVDRAHAVHDAVAAELDEGAIPPAGAARRSRPVRDRSDAWLTWLSWRRRLMLVVLALLLPLPVVAARYIPPDAVESELLQRVVLFCMCNPTAWRAACVVAFIVSIVVTPRMMPAVSVRERSGARKLGLSAPTVAGFLINLLV